MTTYSLYRWQGETEALYMSGVTKDAVISYVNRFPYWMVPFLLVNEITRKQTRGIGISIVTKFKQGLV